jgi:hypothetical protein
MVFRSALAITAVCGLKSSDLKGMKAEDQLLTVFGATKPSSEIETAFLKVFDDLARHFPAEEYSSFVQELTKDLETFTNSKAYRAVGANGQCATGMNPVSVSGMSAFPGGIVRRSLGFDLAQLVYEIASKASGPAASAAVMTAPLATVALQQAAGTIQAMVHTALSVVPPTIPGKNTPLTCMPMVSGHNCAGAVLYPITAADFAIADATDASLDGVIAAFPGLYAKRVGKTSDAAYRKCFNAFMGMKCGSLFPRCAVPEASQAPAVGKLGLCFTSCIATLVACPGMFYEDVKEECGNAVSAPPACTMALFTSSFRAAPQYVTAEEAPLKCE